MAEEFDKGIIDEIVSGRLISGMAHTVVVVYTASFPAKK